MTPQEQITDQINNLQTALLEQHPQMPQILRSVLLKLKADPEVVTLLTEEQIGTVVKSAIRHSGAVIMATASKSATKKSLSKTSVDDI